MEHYKQTIHNLEIKIKSERSEQSERIEQYEEELNEYKKLVATTLNS